MVTTLSSKGQVVLPKNLRTRLGLRSGTKLDCRIKDGAIVLTPQDEPAARTRLVREARTGLYITRSSKAGPRVTSEQVRAAMDEFP